MSQILSFTLFVGIFCLLQIKDRNIDDKLYFIQKGLVLHLGRILKKVCHAPQIKATFNYNINFSYAWMSTF